MPLHEQGLDRFPVLARLQLCIAPPVLHIHSGIEISMRLVATDLTTKRLLIGPVGFIDRMAHAALLGGIGTPD